MLFLPYIIFYFPVILLFFPFTMLLPIGYGDPIEVCNPSKKFYPLVMIIFWSPITLLPLP